MSATARSWQRVASRVTGRRWGLAFAAVDLHCSLTMVGQRPVVVVRGELDLATMPTLRDAVLRAIQRHPGTGVYVDLDEVGSVDDVALGVMPALDAAARRGGGTLHIVAGHGPVVARLADLRLDQILTVSGSLHS